ncbi:unnamed protein product [Bursaphelenchus xylophilus]|uniref:(pine wood nematode) hypothetical protein n=1 Tax=Bursaphelenchus xylophilus TaxID=6326 RepID=A0A1I7SS30_BURXY|nr:unnamed protein product [Bursaphelenchus xylophilus]CAG9105745.1 unnamed protein product [Bursaphelenchus xylophilus]
MSVDVVLMVYIFPVLFVIGVVGNAINLLVLLDKRMRSKTNTLLSVMALADIFFLVFMMVHSLMYHNDLMAAYASLRRFFVYAAPHISGIINMLSFISAWTIVLVSVERMTAVMFPLRARSFWTYHTLKILVTVLVTTSFLITMHSHITHQVTVIHKNITLPSPEDSTPTIVQRKVLRSMLRTGMESYWRISTIATAVFIVFLPVIIVIITNSLVFCALRAQNDSILATSSYQKVRSKRSEDSMNSVSSMDRHGSLSRKPSRNTYCTNTTSTPVNGTINDSAPSPITNNNRHYSMPESARYQNQPDRKIHDNINSTKSNPERSMSCLPTDDKTHYSTIHFPTQIPQGEYQPILEQKERKIEHKSSTGTSNTRNQRRATLIVFIIACTFTISQTPSALVHIGEICWPWIGMNPAFKTAATLSNSLVAAGKTMNLFLFCMWSAHFRRNLKRILSSKLPTLYAFIQKLTQVSKVVGQFPSKKKEKPKFDQKQIITVHPPQAMKRFSTPILEKSKQQNEECQAITQNQGFV